MASAPAQTSSHRPRDNGSLTRFGLEVTAVANADVTETPTQIGNADDSTHRNLAVRTDPILRRATPSIIWRPPAPYANQAIYDPGIALTPRRSGVAGGADAGSRAWSDGVGSPT